MLLDRSMDTRTSNAVWKVCARSTDIEPPVHFSYVNVLPNTYLTSTLLFKFTVRDAGF